MGKMITIAAAAATSIALTFGTSVATAPAAEAAAPKNCTTLTGNWWIIPAPVGTPLYHFVVAEKVVNEGNAAYFCIWEVADRKPRGGHTSRLDVAKPGPNIHVKSTTKWTLVTPKPFKIYAGQKFKATAKVTIAAPHLESGKQTITRSLTVKLKPGGQIV